MAIGVWHGQVCLCDWIESRRFPAHLAASRNAFLGIDVTNEADMELVSSVAGWIGRYLDGERERMPFDIAPVGTPFQKSVWDVIAGIPYGGTLSYSALASAIGRPDAVRAVASACASNPVSLLVPCHRVVGSDGTLTGYAGGVDAKASLLAMEGLPSD
ncbi:MAG: methylated-DNA--[protein]-cysteine S-methyltransferase [Muribaculaceae bacterium]